MIAEAHHNVKLDLYSTAMHGNMMNYQNARLFLRPADVHGKLSRYLLPMDMASFLEDIVHFDSYGTIVPITKSKLIDL